MLDFGSFLKSRPLVISGLITVINPLGTGFTLSAMTSGISDEMRRSLGRKISLNTMLIFIIILAFGKYILLFFGLSLPIIRVGGGLLLAVMGWNMLNASHGANDSDEAGPSEAENSDFQRQAFFPFTFPVTAGPGCIAVIFTLSAHHSAAEGWAGEVAGLSGTLLGLFGVAVVTYFCYVYSRLIEVRLGQSGAQALNRIMAFITLCIGLQILWTGVLGLVKSI
ncbi:MAG: NAAT family transporter [Calothrix sp. SM1_5_4]|nr:NAAT family transporter [Calothrix sp. SM1_5_4]